MMLIALLVVLVVAGTIGLYAVSRRRYGVDQRGATVIAAIGAGVSVLVAVVALAGRTASPEADVPASGGAALTTAAALPDQTPAPITQLPLDQGQRLHADSQTADGNVDAAVFAPANGGSYDPPTHVMTLKRGAVATLSGWGAKIDPKGTYEGLVLVVDGRVAATGKYHEDRLDVARYYKVPELRFIGFHAQVPRISPGHHVLKVGLARADGQTFQYIPATISLTVTP